jgi:GT2 family glycosyltransferase
MNLFKVAVVLIGRNEGARLRIALTALADKNVGFVYVDSGSDDDSVAQAQAAGAIVVELDRSAPFTAARGRNAGFQALDDSGEMPEFIQFIDGDCALVPGWLQAGAEALAADETLAIVTGWRSELHPKDSIYNRLCDNEWHRPAGDIKACGGDMMVRTTAFQATGGFDPNVIAAEDDEFCIRIRAAGWRIRRLPLPMTRHDAAMTRFAEWWQRAKRSGHGFAQVGAMHPPYFQRERRRAVLFGAVLPLFGLLALSVGPLWLLWVIAALYGVSYLRGAANLAREGLELRDALWQASFLSLSKFPNLIGMLIYYRRRLGGRKMMLIEYK